MKLSEIKSVNNVKHAIIFQDHDYRYDLDTTLLNWDLVNGWVTEIQNSFIFS
jgi:hypothetical protein